MGKYIYHRMTELCIYSPSNKDNPTRQIYELMLFIKYVSFKLHVKNKSQCLHSPVQCCLIHMQQGSTVKKPKAVRKLPRTLLIICNINSKNKIQKKPQQKPPKCSFSSYLKKCPMFEKNFLCSRDLGYIFLEKLLDKFEM